MRKSSVTPEPDAAQGHQALLTLRRGVSARGTWAFDACDAGTTITLGAGASCDWQIASPGIAPVYLAFTGEALLVRALRCDERVRHNGEVLTEGWITLDHGDTLDLGPSKIAVSLAPGRRSKASRRAERQRQKRTSKRGQQGRAKGERQREATPQEAPRLPRRPHALVPQVDPLRSASALFDEAQGEAQPAANARMWYAAIAFGTLLAYVGWLTLLDEF